VRCAPLFAQVQIDLSGFALRFQVAQGVARSRLKPQGAACAGRLRGFFHLLSERLSIGCEPRQQTRPVKHGQVALGIAQHPYLASISFYEFHCIFEKFSLPGSKKSQFH